MPPAPAAYEDNPARTLWALLYETSARVAELLRLDMGDLDLRNCCAHVVVRKGSAPDVAIGTAAGSPPACWHARSRAGLSSPPPSDQHVLEPTN